MSIGDTEAEQFERFLLLIKPSGKPSWPLHDCELEIHDVTTGALVWNKHFSQEVPEYYASPTANRLILVWPASGKGAKTVIDSDPTLRSRFTKLTDKEGNFLVQVFELSTARMLGGFPVSTGKSSFAIRGAFSAGDWVYLNDNENRVLIYSLDGVQNSARIFGHETALSTSAKLLCIQNETAKLEFYDLDSFQKRTELVFPARVSFSQFSRDGKRLLVVTDDQYAYTIQLEDGAPPKSQMAAQN